MAEACTLEDKPLTGPQSPHIGKPADPYTLPHELQIRPQLVPCSPYLEYHRVDVPRDARSSRIVRRNQSYSQGITVV